MAQQEILNKELTASLKQTELMFKHTRRDLSKIHQNRNASQSPKTVQARKLSLSNMTSP